MKAKYSDNEFYIFFISVFSENKTSLRIKYKKKIKKITECAIVQVIRNRRSMHERLLFVNADIGIVWKQVPFFKPLYNIMFLVVLN